MLFALSHQDGTLRKTTKSVVLNLPEEQVEVVTCLVPSTLRTVHIIDGMVLARRRPGSSEAHQESLGMVGLSSTLNDALRVKCERFLCALYPAVKKTSEYC